MKNRWVSALSVVGAHDSSGIQIDLGGLGECRVGIGIEIRVCEERDRHLVCVKLEKIPAGIRLGGVHRPFDRRRQLQWNYPPILWSMDVYGGRQSLAKRQCVDPANKLHTIHIFISIGSRSRSRVGIGSSELQPAGKVIPDRM